MVDFAEDAIDAKRRLSWIDYLYGLAERIAAKEGIDAASAFFLLAITLVECQHEGRSDPGSVKIRFFCLLLQFKAQA